MFQGAGVVILLLQLLSILSLRQCLCSKILMMPANHGSHVNFFSVAGEALHKAGHDVYILVSEKESKRVLNHGLKVMNMGHIPSFLNDDEQMQKFAFEDGSLSQLLVKLVNISKSYCETTLSQDELMLQLKHENFDLILIDSFDIIRCMYIIPFNLGVPYISMGYRHDPWNAKIPALPSVEGQLGFYLLYKDSTFLDRLKNTMITVLVHTMLPLPSMVNPDYLTKYAADKPATTFKQLYHNSEMWIENLDTVCLDFPKVHGLHYLFIAGLGCKPANPLPRDMEEFAQKSKGHGIIVLTFGSGLSRVPKEMMMKLIAAFKEIPQHVFMRYEGKIPDDKPDNVYLSSWLPQNDLLGHPKTKLFISHGGNNGQLEALYHGVPLLTIPMTGDQVYSGKRAALHGYGIMLDSRTFTSEQLLTSIQEMLNNNKYATNIKHCSEVFRSLSKPHDELTFWVNHVLKFGGSHLKPNYMDLPLWQFFMLDVMAFILVIFVVLVMCVWYFCFKLLRKCRRQKQAKQKSK